MSEPLIFETSFPVRFSECDAYGHVNHAHYVRYMVEAAFLASAGVGYDLPKMKSLGHVWLPHEHDITYLRPLEMGQIVTVKTWVVDFRRVRSLRKYELYADGVLAATAQTDWVYVYEPTQQPAAIPADLIHAFWPNGTPPQLPREPFPTPAPYSVDLFTRSYPVEWRDVDPQQHVNNAAYLSYIENCAMELSRVCGWPAAKMIEHGFGIFARNYRLQYLAPAFLDDQLEVSTWISDLKRSTAVRHYEVRRAADNTLVVRGRALWVWVGLKTGYPIRIPAEFIQSFVAHFSPAASP